jgi:hypothetical protein
MVFLLIYRVYHFQRKIYVLKYLTEGTLSYIQGDMGTAHEVYFLILQTSSPTNLVLLICYLGNLKL